MEEFMFLGLRLTEGVDPTEFARLYGRSMDDVYGGVIEKNLREGLLYRYQCKKCGGERLALTDLGLDVSNYVMGQFLL